MVDLCCNVGLIFFAPTVRLSEFIQLFASVQKPLLLAFYPARKLLQNRIPQTMFVHRFGCVCVCLYV